MNIRTRAAAALTDDAGSILPLIVGYGVLLGALLIVTTDLTSLHIAQKQTAALADAAALAAADGFELTVTEGEAVARLDDAEARRQAAAVLAASPHPSTLADLVIADGVTARVTVTTVWHPPLTSVLVPDGLVLGATGTGRTALG